MERKLLKIAAQLLKEGKVALFPTDTVYGLLADATNKKAIEKVFRIKKRSAFKPIPIFVRSIAMAERFAVINPEQKKFLQKVWPGAVTIILKRKKIGTKLYGAAKNSLALRVPNYPPLNFLLKKLSFPLSGTSANISGRPTPASLRTALSQFRGKKNLPDFAVNGGTLSGKPSTIIDYTVNPPSILRQ